MKVAIRDDDTSYFTKPKDLQRAYDFLNEDDCVSLSVVPYTVPVHRDDVFPYGKEIGMGYVDEHENAYYYENLNVDSFLYLVKNSIALIGNSSSGIIETPSLGRYTINIGDRQRGRVHGNSVIDVTCDSSIIGQAMKEITGKENYYKKTKEILENGTSILKEFYDIV